MWVRLQLQTVLKYNAKCFITYLTLLKSVFKYNIYFCYKYGLSVWALGLTVYWRHLVFRNFWVDHGSENCWKKFNVMLKKCWNIELYTPIAFKKKCWFMTRSFKEWDLHLQCILCWVWNALKALEETFIAFYNVFANASKAICRHQKDLSFFVSVSHVK